MKIIYITASLPLGKGEAFSFPEVQELRRQGHDVVLVPLNPKGNADSERAEELLSVSVVLPILSKAVLKDASREAFRRPSALNKLAVSAIFGRTSFIGRAKNFIAIPKALWLANLAREVGANHIHANWASTHATVAMIAASLAQIPFSFTCHRYDILEDNLLKEKFARSAFVRAISDDGADLLARAGISRTHPKLRVIHMGVDLPPRVPSIPDRPKPVILCPGFLNPRKRQIDLIEAAAILKRQGEGFTLWLAGEGPSRKMLVAAAQKLGLASDVHFLGHLDHQSLLSLYETASVDIVALASLHEGIPVALIEALGYGVPAVATSVGGIPELLRGGAGILVPPRSPGDLANGLRSLLRDKSFRERLGALGRERSVAEFDLTNVGRLLSDEFAKATASI